MATTVIKLTDEEENTVNGMKYFFKVKRKEDAIRCLIRYFKRMELEETVKVDMG